MTHISEETRGCIDDCGTCHDVCLETSMHCLEMGGKHAEARHLRLLRECAEICQTSAYFMLIGSEFHKDTCELCARICEQCARSCDRFDDGFMKRCADVCRKCAESCRKMSGTRKAA
jgi:hypothetical protein